jgi:hypothetical protein
MNASLAARVLDPLAEHGSVEQDELPSEAAGKARVAPDVVGLKGVVAVTTLRTSGFIAAIESVPSDGADEGSVIEQEPPAGTALDREGVVTLRLAVARELPIEPPALAAEPECDPSASEDDTDRWFAELAGVGQERATIDPTPAPRHRKPRPIREPIAAPRPVPAAPDAPVTDSWIVSAAGVLARVPWRRGAGVAGIVICTVVTTRLIGSDRLDPSALERRLAASEQRAAVHAAATLARVTVTSETQITSAASPVKVRRREHSRPSAGHSHRPTARRASAHVASVTAAASPPPVTAAASVAATPSATPAPAPSPQATGSQFAYLGQ